MPVATPEQYAEMLDKAKAGGYAFPAINASSSQSINAILQGPVSYTHLTLPTIYSV